MKIWKSALAMTWIAAMLVTLAIGSAHAQGPASLTAPEIFDDGSATTIVADIQVNNVEGLWGVQFELRWDPTILTATGVAGVGDFSYAWPTTISEGYLITAWSWPLGELTGSYIYTPTTVVQVTFNVVGAGASALDLQGTILVKVDGTTMTHTVTDGYFVNVAIVGNADLIKKAAWPDHVTWVVSRDPQMLLFAKVKSFANVAMLTKVVWTVRDPISYWTDVHETRVVLQPGQQMELTTTISFAELVPGYGYYEGWAQAFYKDSTGNWIAGATVKKFHFNAQQPGQQP